MTLPAGLIFALQTLFRLHILCVVLRAEEERVEGVREDAHETQRLTEGKL